MVVSECFSSLDLTCETDPVRYIFDWYMFSLVHCKVTVIYVIFRQSISRIYITEIFGYVKVNARLTAVRAAALSSSTPSQEPDSNKVARAMARVASVLPPSLSPHICIISSPDLADLLSALSLPPLPRILQSFSPLPQGKMHFVRGINTVNLHALLSHNEDNIVDTSAPRVVRFALLRLDRSRRGMS